MDESPTNPHYHTLDGCTFIYTYIQNTQIIVAQFLHMGELTPQQLTKSLFAYGRTYTPTIDKEPVFIISDFWVFVDSIYIMAL